MSKKKKKQKPEKRTADRKHTAIQSKKKSKFHILAFMVGGVFFFTGLYSLLPGEEPALQPPVLSESKKKNTNLQENRPTLSPQRFTGTFRLAYEVARKIPEVLDQLYCYCRCQENFGHKNLLSCYVDTHAST